MEFFTSFILLIIFLIAFYFLGKIIIDGLIFFWIRDARPDLTSRKTFKPLMSAFWPLAICFFGLFVIFNSFITFKNFINQIWIDWFLPD